jgi:hypothetical protein
MRFHLHVHAGLRPLVAGVAAVALVGLSAGPGRAHEVPAGVAVQAYVKPEGRTLRLLVRVPLGAMRDIDFPLTGPGYLVLDRVAPHLREAARLWIAEYVQLYEGDTALGPEALVAARVSTPTDRSFTSWEGALAHVTGPPLPPETRLIWSQALLDVLFQVPIAADGSRFSIDPALAHLGVETVSVIHFLPPQGGERVFQYRGNPGVVRLDPRWTQATLRFVGLGFLHILDGIDHLLFILCLVIPFRRLGGLIRIVTAFTVAHSITLVASAAGLAPGALWFPPLIETLIAASIVYMALENIVGARQERRWLIAFGFGLVHGFGFSFALRESLQFAGRHLLSALLAFNVGVELGQVFVLALAIPVLGWLFRRVVAERMGTIILSALVAHTAWHWMTARGTRLLAYDFTRPALSPSLAVALVRWAMLAVITVGAAWGLSRVYAWAGRRPAAGPGAHGGPAGARTVTEALEPHVR